MPDDRRPPRGPVRRLLLHPGFLVPGVLVAVAALTGRRIVPYLLLLGVISLARVASGFRLDHWIPQAVTRLVQAVGSALFGALFVIAILPAHLLGRWGRARARRHAGGWVTRSGGSSDPRSLGTDGGRTIGGSPRWLAAVGMVALVLLTDQVVGRIWDAQDPRIDPSDALAEPTLINVSGAEAPRDPRADDPAMGGAEWAEAYFRELNTIQATYWPFVLFRNLPYQGTHVNGEGWTRRSWSPPAPSGFELPLLSFYGGSTTFGIGQRDQHTIPSEVARLAAAEGYPVRVVNHGMNGFVSWQELLLFEHFTAAGERPLRAVFYDGANEVYAQRQPAVHGNPADTQVDDVGERLASPPGDPSSADVEQPDPSPDLWTAYRRTSALDRLAETLGPVLGGTPAGASAAQSPSQQEIGTAAVAVYERSRSLIGEVADDAGITPVFFWQPAPGGDDPDRAYRAAVEQLTRPTISLADCLDAHQDVYLADAHTNEEGARIVAGCMWADLGPAVREWYRSQDIDRQVPVVGTDDVVPSLAPADLEVPPSLLGPGWSSAVPIPNVLTACATSLGTTRPTVATGPSFGLSSTEDIGRLTTSALTYPTEAAATESRGVLVRQATACLERQAIETLSVEEPVRWIDEPDAGGAADGISSWTAEARIGSVEQPGRLHLELIQDGATLLVVEVTGTGGVDVVDVGSRVGRHLASG